MDASWVFNEFFMLKLDECADNFAAFHSKILRFEYKTHFLDLYLDFGFGGRSTLHSACLPTGTACSTCTRTCESIVGCLKYLTWPGLLMQKLFNTQPPPASWLLG